MSYCSLSPGGDGVQLLYLLAVCERSKGRDLGRTSSKGNQIKNKKIQEATQTAHILFLDVFLIKHLRFS